MKKCMERDSFCRCVTSKLNYFLPRATKGQEKISCVCLPRIPDQGCQFGFFEAKFVIFGLFSTPLAFFIFEKRPNEIWLFWPLRFSVSIWQIRR